MSGRKHPASGERVMKLVRRWSGVAIYLGGYAVFELDHTGYGWSFRVAIYLRRLHYEWYRRRDLGAGVVLERRRAA